MEKQKTKFKTESLNFQEMEEINGGGNGLNCVELTNACAAGFSFWGVGTPTIFGNAAICAAAYQACA